MEILTTDWSVDEETPPTCMDGCACLTCPKGGVSYPVGSHILSILNRPELTMVNTAIELSYLNDNLGSYGRTWL
jgi:hypothetical protein